MSVIETARAIEMLRVAAEMLLKSNPSGTVFYDGADCDCFCIAEDCEAAALDLESEARK